MEDCVGDQQFMLCTLLQKEEAIAVALSYSFSPNHSFPGFVVCAHSSIEACQEDKFVCPGGVAEITEFRSSQNMSLTSSGLVIVVCMPPTR